jgi:hypothetical protein
MYGANASGKSNLVSAIEFMRDAVVESHRHWEPDGGVPRVPFAWGEKKNQPSLFEVTLVLEGTRFAYGFTVDDQEVCEEWLFAWPSNRKQVWFERDKKKFKFGSHMDGPNETVREVTRENALFLSASAQHGHDALMPLYKWFYRTLSILQSDRLASTMPRRIRDWLPGTSADTFSRAISSPMDEFTESRVASMRSLLQAADFGIVDIKRVEIESDNGMASRKRWRIVLQHQADDDESWLDLDQESAGTKKLFRLAPYIFDALESGGVLFVDELESSLHPLLGLEVVKLFHSLKTNPRNAQLMFTTHDTNLLGNPPLLGESATFRRDQVWFAEKDASGASRIYPLTDYKPRKVENLERGYLQGRYGAIPFLERMAQIGE